MTTSIAWGSLMFSSAEIRRLLENRHLRYGIPFLTLVIGAPFVLRGLQQSKFDNRRQKLVNEKLDERFYEAGIERKKNVTAEEIYQRYAEKDLEEDDYQMVRGPRPWEDNAQYEELRKSGAKPVKKVEKSQESLGY